MDCNDESSCSRPHVACAVCRGGVSVRSIPERWCAPQHCEGSPRSPHRADEDAGGPLARGRTARGREAFGSRSPAVRALNPQAKHAPGRATENGRVPLGPGQQTPAPSPFLPALVLEPEFMNTAGGEARAGWGACQTVECTGRVPVPWRWAGDRNSPKVRGRGTCEPSRAFLFFPWMLALHGLDNYRLNWVKRLPYLIPDSHVTNPISVFVRLAFRGVSWGSISRLPREASDAAGAGCGYRVRVSAPVKPYPSARLMWPLPGARNTC